MASTEKDVLSCLCIQCSKKVRNGLKCVKCALLAHPSCAERMKNVRIVEEGMICCDTNLKVDSEISAESVITEDLNISEEHILKREVEYLKIILSHKNYIIRELQEKIKLIQNNTAKNVNNQFPLSPLPGETSVDIGNLSDLQPSLRSMNVKVFKNGNTVSDMDAKPSHSKSTSPDITVISDNIGEVKSRLKTADNNQVVNNNRKHIFSKKDVSYAIHDAVNQQTFLEIQNLEETNDEIMRGEWLTQNRRKRRRQYLIGGNEVEKSVETVPKFVSLHGTRLKPQTTPDNLHKMLAVSFPEVQCVVHKSKMPEAYSSMKVTINQENLKRAWNKDVWPKGAVVSKFFVKRRVPI
ncbi:uncharacterized protein LOC126887684 [Diabrotica virgifera virgifera]|uniref:Phorbol-ester/DAG-type domain-containing protein n=1 Tax=Diabrotica virgifera virgifera TaxID=50390 RepID=A0ABM5KM67_DIAVI|nr:uncharacterized protein LOC126887684 [Diabrotica virgifera virgifera]